MQGIRDKKRRKKKRKKGHESEVKGTDKAVRGGITCAPRSRRIVFPRESQGSSSPSPSSSLLHLQIGEWSQTKLEWLRIGLLPCFIHASVLLYLCFIRSWLINHSFCFVGFPIDELGVVTQDDSLLDAAALSSGGSGYGSRFSFESSQRIERT